MPKHSALIIELEKLNKELPEDEQLEFSREDTTDSLRELLKKAQAE